MFFLLDLILTHRFPKFRSYTYHLPASIIAACLILLVIDNFTYTLFSFGIIDSKPIFRVFYAFFFILLIYLLNRRMSSGVHIGGKTSMLKSPGFFATLLLGGSLLITLTSIQFLGNSNFHLEDNESSNKKPNIILLGTDGLNAQNMSAYGYERDTTPFIRELAKSSLLGENHFSNASRTLGSTVSILTGKSPLTTRVLYPPDILGGKDMFQHLPGILKANGYTNVSLGVPYYVDPNAVNFKDAFDSINCRENHNKEYFGGLSKIGLFSENYFLNTVLSRIGDRVMHVFFIKDMVNPYLLVIDRETDALQDFQRMSCLFSFLDEAEQSGKPLFAHIHLLGTKGPQLHPTVQVFSKGQVQNEDWMTDFYDDTILNYDQQVASLVDYLRSHDQFEDTLIVLLTDHGQQYKIINKLPLIIHFPGNEHAGSIRVNTQNLDIAPTILDYLGIEIPPWMNGDSLLQKLDPLRIIIAVEPTPFEIVNGRSVIQKSAAEPPFYQFGKITAFQCQQITIIDLKKIITSEVIVKKHTSPCSPELLDSQDEIMNKISDFLLSKGYDLPEKW